jgi:hypothetical protein
MPASVGGQQDIRSKNAGQEESKYIKTFFTFFLLRFARTVI